MSVFNFYLMGLAFGFKPEELGLDQNSCL